MLTNKRFERSRGAHLALECEGPPGTVVLKIRRLSMRLFPIVLFSTIVIIKWREPELGAKTTPGATK